MTANPYTHTEVEIRNSCQLVSLQLPTDVQKCLKKLPLQDSDFASLGPDLHNTTYETSFGSFYTSKNKDSELPLFSYTVSKSNTNSFNDVFTISPFQINRINDSVLYSYKFALPSPVFQNCVSISETDSDLFVDILLESNLVITLKLNYQCFFSDKFLSFENIHNWCNYTIPYAFNQRTPISMKNLSCFTAVISTIDGGLLLLDRSDSNLEYSITPLTSTSYMDSIKYKFFGKSLNKNNVVEFNNLDYNISSYVDILPLTTDIFATVSIDKKLTFWSASLKKILNEVSINDYLPEIYHSSILSPYSTNSILKLSDNLLTIFLPFVNSTILIFSLNFENDCVLPNLSTKIESPNYNDQWKPIGYCIFHQNETLNISISWIFGESTLFESCKISNDSNNTVEWTSAIDSNKFKEIKNKEFLNKVNNFQDLNVLNSYCNRFIQSQYNLQSIELVFELLNKKFDLTKNLDGQIIEIVKEKSDSLTDYKTEWVKFISICQDVENKISKKIISITIDPSDEYSDNPFIVILNNNNNYSLITKSSLFESLYFNINNDIEINSKFVDVIEDIDITELSKLVKLILDYSKGYSTKVSTNISNLIINNENDTKKLMTEIFDKYIIKIADNTVVFKLLEMLSSIKNAPDLMKFLSISLTTLFDEYRNSNIGCPFIKENESLIINSILSNNLVAKKIIFGLILILSTIDISEPVIILFSNLIEIFKFIELFEDVCYIPNKNLIIDYLKLKNKSIYIKNNTLQLTITNILKQLFNKDFIYFIISELISNKNILIVKDFIKYLPIVSPLSTILKSLILLEEGKSRESKELFLNNFEKIIKYCEEITDDEKISIESIRGLSSLILVNSKVDYFYNLSIIFESKKYYIEALELSLKSSKMMNEENKIDEDKEYDIFYKIFELSLKLKQYDMSFESIKEMKFKNRVIPIKKFIYKLFQENQLNKVVEYAYAEDFELVDSLIFGMGEEVLKSMEMLGDIKLALKYYRICYSLRMKCGDYRGAIESLYRFNSVVNYKNDNLKNNEEKNKILKDNYVIMINLLKSLNEGDRWCILKALEGSNEGDKVVYDTDLEEEYEKFQDQVQEAERGLYLM